MKSISFKHPWLSLVVPLALYSVTLFAHVHISIEGNVGAGKSTLFSLLQEHIPEITFVKEPIPDWETMGGNGNLLARFSRDHQRYGFIFDGYCYVSYLNEMKKNLSHATVVSERSYLSVYYYFAPADWQQGWFDDLEYYTLKKLYQCIQELKPPPLHGIVYLKTSPNTCFARSKKRNMYYDQNITLSFYETMHYWIERWLVEKQVDFVEHKNTPVLILDGEQDFLACTEVQTNFVTQIKNFIDKITQTS